MNRNVRNRRPALESMEGRLAPSTITPVVSPVQEVRHDRIDNDRIDNDHHDRDDHDHGDGHGWEPRPILIGSPR